jgi:hypothetical protein
VKRYRHFQCSAKDICPALSCFKRDFYRSAAYWAHSGPCEFFGQDVRDIEIMEATTSAGLFRILMIAVFLFCLAGITLCSAKRTTPAEVNEAHRVRVLQQWAFAHDREAAMMRGEYNR